MHKKTAIIFCLISMIFAQDNVELEENRHFNSYQINLDRFKQLNEDITTPNTIVQRQVIQDTNTGKLEQIMI